MRRGWLLLGGIVLAVLALPAHQVFGEVYEAPYYLNQGPVAMQASYGPGSGPCGPVCGPVCDPCCGNSPATKLGRGVSNVLTGWMEVPKHVVTGVFNCNVTPLEGLGVGFFRGWGRAIERTGVGLFEVVTFPLPGYDPLLCPEYVSLEPACMNWRRGQYQGCWMPGCGCCPQPCDPCWGNVAAPRPVDNRMAMGGSSPSEPPAAGTPSGDRRPGPVIYPDKYLE
ncbi:MAG: exosortase system-associated protein, TIGR04073 family [Candidatus Omnitrophica bacterium]|nr:hypothetical protein [bacterium]NUN96155.1 exosortase system-associated protein, TIGR04073 family [Candidatus Omnitrophota bacterium]